MPDDLHLPDRGTPSAELRLTIDGTPDAVRDGLRQMQESAVLAPLAEADRGTAEIVLAEALNNIVEHAYARHAGQIEVVLQRQGQRVDCQISDTGLPMPDGKLPEGRLLVLQPGDDLPEGGFGWHLIRSLSEDLRYRRHAGCNHLSFRLIGEQSNAEDGIVSP